MTERPSKRAHSDRLDDLVYCSKVTLNVHAQQLRIMRSVVNALCVTLLAKLIA